MKKFIHEENLKLFRKQLAETTDPKRRQLLLSLIEAEEANDVEEDHLSDKSSGDRREKDRPSELRYLLLAMLAALLIVEAALTG